MDKIAVLIPCYNESMTIQKVVTDFKMALPDAKIYVYDNNSSDNTALLASQAGAIVRHEPQQGKGNVVRRMFQEIDAHCYILTDGDDTYPAQAGLQMADMVLSQHIDMVIEIACPLPIFRKISGFSTMQEIFLCEVQLTDFFIVI